MKGDLWNDMVGSMKKKQFPNDLPFVRGIHWSQRASNVEFCIFLCHPKQRAEQAVKREVN